MAGGVMFLFISAVYIGLAIFMISVVWRAMRAHERLADAVEKLAQRQEKTL